MCKNRCICLKLWKGKWGGGVRERKRCPYSADSRRWADPGISRGISRRTRSSACLAGRCPTAAPHIRSSKWGSWPSTPRNCEAWWRRWGRSEPAGSFYKHDSSASDVEKKNVSLIWAINKSLKNLERTGKPTSSSLPRVVEAIADVMPALREFCTRDWRQKGKERSLYCLRTTAKSPDLYCIWFLYDNNNTHHRLMGPDSEDMEKER